MSVSYTHLEQHPLLLTAGERPVAALGKGRDLHFLHGVRRELFFFFVIKRAAAAASLTS